MLVGRLLKEDDIDFNVIWTFEHGHANSSQLAARLTMLHEVAGRDLRIQRFGFSPQSPGVVPEIPLQLADALAYATIQPHGSFKVLDLLARRPRGVLCRYELSMTPSMVHKVWSPIAEVEAKNRKFLRLARKGLAVIERQRESYGDEDVFTVDGDELIEIEKSVAKLNKIAKILDLGSTVAIKVSDDSEDDQMAT
jgi:hypothetical protein